MGKLPSFQFYPGDWKKDAGVQALSYEERGIWFELMLMMFESPERGKLIFRTGTPIPEDAVARALGLDKQKVNQILSKLLEYGVASKEEDTGIIYCRRMVRDAELSKKRAECGKLGGNPNLLNQNSSKREPKLKQNGKQNPTPSSSSSISKEEKYIEKEDSSPEEAKVWTLGEFLTAAKEPSVALPEKDATECFDFYAAQGFRRSNGQPIVAVAPLLRQWKRKLGEFSARGGGAKTDASIDAYSLERAYEWVSGHFIGEYDADPRGEDQLRAWAAENGIFGRLRNPNDKLYQHVYKTRK